MKATEVAKELLPLLRDQDKYIRGWAAIALVELGEKKNIPMEVIKDILPILKWDGDDEEAAARRAESALKALGVAEEEIRRAKE